MLGIVLNFQAISEDMEEDPELLLASEEDGNTNNKEDTEEKEFTLVPADMHKLLESCFNNPQPFLVRTYS